MHPNESINSEFSIIHDRITLLSNGRKSSLQRSEDVEQSKIKYTTLDSKEKKSLSEKIENLNGKVNNTRNKSKEEQTTDTEDGGKILPTYEANEIHLVENSNHLVENSNHLVENSNHLVDNSKFSQSRDKLCVVLTEEESKSKSFLYHSKSCQFLVYALGVFFPFLLFGLGSEKVLVHTFGPNEERFTSIFTYNLILVISNYLFAQVLVRRVFKKCEDKTETKYYLILAFTSFMGLALGTKALTWINYPTQILGKTMKPITVMVFSVILGKKRYTVKRYFFVLLVVVGVSMFMVNRKTPSRTHYVNYNQTGIISINATDFNSTLSMSSNHPLTPHLSGFKYWGELCVLVSLVFDGMTGAVQERMRHDFHTKPGHFMLNSNKFILGYLVMAMIGWQEVPEFLRFVQKYPSTIGYISIIAICSAVGQTFIFLMLSHFGSLPVSLTTTTRKFFNILGSIIIFKHTMCAAQWIATGLVFLGLLMDAYFSKRKQKKKVLPIPNNASVISAVPAV